MALDLVTVTGNPGPPQWKGQGEGWLDRWQTKATWREGEARVTGTKEKWGRDGSGDLGPEGHTLQNY